jgi:hypothetical protein
LKTKEDEMSTRSLVRTVLSHLATAALSALVLVALAAPAGAQASRTRPPSGGSSSGHSSGSSGSSSAGHSSGSSGSSTSVHGSSSSGWHSSSNASRTRPREGGSSSPAVIDHDRRRGGGGSYHHGSGGYPYSYRSYDPFFFSFGFGYPYWGSQYWGSGPYYGGEWWNWGYRYPHPYAQPYGGVAVYPSQSSQSMGALDLDVWPAQTQVYIDGEYVGVVDSFDGWPRYLWLEKGTYDVVFYLDGFKTLARQYSIYPGLVIDVDDRLEPGEAVRPEDLISKSTDRRDARIAQDRAQEQAAERGGRGERAESGAGGWQERVRGEREEMSRQPYDDAVKSGQAVDARGEPGRVHVAVEPDDAAVYLDGRFLGSGRDLARLSSGLIVDPGAHKLSVVRPGRESKSLDFEVAPGQDLDLSVALKAAG